jgi:hypothetical protein
LAGTAIQGGIGGFARTFEPAHSHDGGLIPPQPFGFLERSLELCSCFVLILGTPTAQRVAFDPLPFASGKQPGTSK